MPDRVEREDLGAFVARAVRLDQDSLIRLRMREKPGQSGPAAARNSATPAGEEGRLDVWAATPFDALCTRSVVGSIEPSDVAVSGNELLATLTVAGAPTMDPGRPKDLLWRSELPPRSGWSRVDDLPASEVSEVAERGVELAKEHVGPKGTPPASLMDQEVFTVSGSGYQVKVPLRCLFVLSGMGFLPSPAPEGEIVRISATDAWVRLDCRYGAVVRRRHALLPLLM